MQASKQACKADSPCVLEFPGLGVVPNVRTRLFVWTKEQQDRSSLVLCRAKNTWNQTCRGIAVSNCPESSLPPVSSADSRRLGRSCRPTTWTVPGRSGEREISREDPNDLQAELPSVEETPIGRGRRRDGISEGKGGRSWCGWSQTTPHGLYWPLFRDDWKPPVKLHKQPKQPAPAPLPRPASPEEEAEMLRRIKEEAAAFRCKVNECNSKKPTLKWRQLLWSWNNRAARRPECRQ